MALAAGACPRCCFVRELCLCADVPEIAIATQLVIVRHVTERERSSNTGRLIALAVPGTLIVDVGDDAAQGLARGELPALEALPREDSWILFPDGESRAVAPSPPPRRVIVLDGTWAQARRMRQKLRGLRGLPALHVATGRQSDAPRMRSAPAPGMVSTIEAVAACVRLLDGDAPARQLERLFATAVDRARRTGRTGTVTG